MTFWSGVYQGKSSPFQVWWPWALWFWRYNDFTLPHDLTRPCNQKVAWFYRQEPIQANYHTAKFDGHRHCKSEVWNFHLSRDLTRPSDQRVRWIYCQEPIKVIYHPTEFRSHRHFGGGYIMFLTCHMILRQWLHKHLLDQFHLSQILLCIACQIWCSSALWKWVPRKKLNSPLWSIVLRFLASRKTRRRRTQTIANRCTFYANARKRKYSWQRVWEL